MPRNHHKKGGVRDPACKNNLADPAYFQLSTSRVK